ncbi:MAG: MarR family winged helix-turn-helix transcriptional regulator [Acidimicrobiales bacterium]
MTPPAVDPLIDAVLRASRALVGVAARSITGVADDVTVPQYRALVVLASHGPQGMAGLASELGVSPSTATRMCDRLVRRGLVRRRISNEDRRQVRLALTSDGLALLEEVTAARRNEIERILGSLSRASRRQLVTSLTAFSEAAGELADEDWAAGWEL